MATCGEDEFGNLYADVHRENVGALRGFGSLCWSCEDESDSSTGTASRRVRPELPLEDCHAEAMKEHCHQSIARAASKFAGDSEEEEGKATVIQLGTCNGASPAERALKQDHLADIVNGKHCLRDAGGAAPGAEDVDTDSDDDLHIVLNPLEGVGNEGSGEDSEDGEDFVILAGNEAINDRGWQGESCRPLEDTAQALFEGGEKLGTLRDEKGQNGKSPSAQLRIGYGSQVYHRHYKYIRESGPSRVGASVSARVNAKPDRFGGGGGFANWRRASLPPRGTGTFQGLSCGLEYSIPANKTVFDVDIDALKEKPWGLSHVDVSDYFNFGFDETSWKKYCKQLAQFCLEITTQSKISVYEGGRIEQSTTGAIQIGGGGESWSSTNIQGQQTRESDAIFLVDVKDDLFSHNYSEGLSVDTGKVNKCLQNCSPKSDIPLGSERAIHQKDQPTVENTNQTSVTRLGAEPQKCGVGSGIERQVNGSLAICSGEGSILPPALRPKSLSPSTPPERVPTHDKRDTERGKSQSSSLNDGSQIAQEDYVAEGFHRIDEVERKESSQLEDYVKVCGRRRVNAALKLCADNCLSGRLDVNRRGSLAIISQLSKRRRLRSHKVNRGTYHSIQDLKKSCRPHTLTAVSGAYNAYGKADITLQKKHMIVNNAVESLGGNKSIGQYVNGSNEQHVGEKAENNRNSMCVKAESNKSKGHGKTDSSQVKDGLQGLHCGSAEEKSNEKLKAKKVRKGRKCKEMAKSKGCPNPEEGQVEGFDKTLQLKKQGTGNMSMISFVSKDNCYYWKKIENVSLGDTQDQNAKKFRSFWQCHEIEQKIEAKRKTHRSNDCLLGHLEIGRDKKMKNKAFKLDGDTQREMASPWKASRIAKNKKMHGKNLLSRERRGGLANTESAANSIFEAHTRESMHATFSKQVSSRKKRKNSESKERQIICKQPHLEFEGLTDLGVPSGQNCKKHGSKKLRKSSCRNSNEPSIAYLAGQQKQDGTDLEDIELMNSENGPSSASICGRVVNSSDLNDKNRKGDSEIRQSQIHSPKACGSEMPNLSVDILNGNSCVGFDTKRKLLNFSTDTLNVHSYIGFDISRLHENHSPAEGLLVEQESVHGTLNESSDDEVKRRGRSKFERWTSHSEQTTHDSCFHLSDMQKVGRISLSRKVSANKAGQCLKHPDESAPECTKQGDNGAVRYGAGKKWTIARRHKGKLRETLKQADNLSVRNEQGSVEQHLDQFVAKLEKRRERFKLSMMEETEPLQSAAIKGKRELLQRSTIKTLPLFDKVVVRLERPARKQCWGGG